MHGLTAELIGLLREEIEQYRRLFSLVRRERGRIVKGELLGIHEMVQKKEAVTRELTRLAVCRRSVLDQLADTLGESREELTLARLVKLSPGETGELLRGLLDEFRLVVGRLVAANDVNRTLLNHSLEMVEGSLALFRTLATPNPTYGSGGRVDEAVPLVSALNQRA
jgi:flagellar biosynthesis/type III secretory pathway chaperone